MNPRTSLRVAVIWMIKQIYRFTNWFHCIHILSIIGDLSEIPTASKNQIKGSGCCKIGQVVFSTSKMYWVWSNSFASFRYWTIVRFELLITLNLGVPELLSGITLGSDHWYAAPCPGPWVRASVMTTSFWTQAQHLHFLHDYIWFIWFDTIICLSNFSCEKETGNVFCLLSSYVLVYFLL